MHLLATTAVNLFPRAFENTVKDLDKRSKDSAEMLDYWDKVDAILGGIKTMREGEELYLPRFTDEDKNDYKFRLKNTKLTNIYQDVLESLSSKPFEEEVSLIKSEEITIPEKLSGMIEDIDGRGNHLTIFAAETFFNGINAAIHWIFVDYPNATAKTVAEARALNIRPFWSHVLGRNVLEANSKIINGKEVLVYIKILEPGSPDHIREFTRDETGKINWKLSEKKFENGVKEWATVDEGTLTIDVIPLVPFMTGRRDGKGYKLFPPMQSAVELQVELFQEESALKFAKKLAAYPMLAGNGIAPQMGPDGKTPAKLAVGPGRVLYAPPDGNGNAGNWAYVEPSATSLEFLAKDIQETKRDLRELGRQPLTAQSGNLTVITAATAAGKAKTAVGAWAFNLKDALENAFVITCKWLNIKESEYSPEVFIYTDFDNFAEGGTDLDALGTARSNGDLSQETYWTELKRRKVLSAEFDAEKEVERILNEFPGDETGDETET